MRRRTVGLLLLGVALCCGSEPVLRTATQEAWALAPPRRGTPQMHPVTTPRVRVTVTAYSRSRRTASGRRVRPGIVALSRDVERALGVTFGAPVVLEGLGTFIFEDRVAARYRRRVDVFLASPQAARRFGIKTTYARGRRASA